LLPGSHYTVVTTHQKRINAHTRQELKLAEIKNAELNTKERIIRKYCNPQRVNKRK
jgi:hypothetical protein